MIRKILPGIAEVTTATTGGGELFSSRCIFLHIEREALAWPIWAILSQINAFLVYLYMTK